MSVTHDVVVVGGGPVGLATAYESAKAGKKVLVLEQSHFYNLAGSSGDLVRMFRTMYTGILLSIPKHKHGINLAYYKLALVILVFIFPIGVYFVLFLHPSSPPPPPSTSSPLSFPLSPTFFSILSLGVLFVILVVRNSYFYVKKYLLYYCRGLFG